MARESDLKVSRAPSADGSQQLHSTLSNTESTLKMSETGRNPLEDIVESLSSSVESAWSFIASPETTSNLHSLPSNIQHSVSAFYSDVYNKLTQGGTLPTLPEWSDIPSPWAQQPQPPTIRTPPPSPPSTAVVVWNKLYSTVDNNRLLFAVITTTSSLGATYYFFPATFKTRILPIFSPLIPIKLLPTPNRPLKATSATGEEFRKEAVLVLGASGVTAELALDLERRGFVVIATVASPAEVDRLEKKSRGWMKVLVLDPVDVSLPFETHLRIVLTLEFSTRQSHHRWPLSFGLFRPHSPFDSLFTLQEIHSLDQCMR